MKKIAVLVIWVFLFQQITPSLLWAGALETAVGNDSSSYELSGNYDITENIPEFGAGKPNNTFTVEGSNNAVINGSTWDGFQVKEGETLQLNNVSLNGFSVGEIDEHNWNMPIKTDGVVIAGGNVINNGAFVPLTATGPEDVTGEVVVLGNFDTTGGALYINKLTVEDASTFTANVAGLHPNLIINDGTMDLDGSLYEKDGKQKRHNISGPVSGNGILNIVGEVKSDGASSTITQSQVNVHTGATLENYTDITAQIINDNKILNAGNGHLYTQGTSVNNGQIIGTGENKGSIVVASGTFTNNGTIDQTSVTINEGAKLVSALDGNFSTNSSVLVNQGTLELTGGTNTLTIADVDQPTAQTPGSKGTLLINGDFENGLGATIQQKNIEVSSGKTFTQNGNMYAALINNGTTINDGSEFKIYGGSNTGIIQNTVANNGGFKLMGGTFDNQGSITQGGVEIYEGATLKTAADKINVYNNTSFRNDGTLILTGSESGLTNTNAITMTDEVFTGVIHIADGKVINNGEIRQHDIYIDAATDTMAAGHLLTTASTVGTDGYQEIRNNGILTLTAGDEYGQNWHAITGTGTLNIAGENETHIQNPNAYIRQSNLNIAAGNTLDFSGGAWGSDVKIITDEHDGTITNEGELITTGEIFADNLVNKNSVFISDGKLSINNNLDNQSGKQIRNGGTLEVANATNAGNIIGNGNSGQLDILGEFENSGSIEQASVLVHNGAQLTTAADKVSMLGTVPNALQNDGTLILTGSQEGITNNNNLTGGGTLVIRDGKIINADGKTLGNKIVVAAADEQKGTTAGNFTAYVKDFRTADMENNSVATLKGFNDSWEEPLNAFDTTVIGNGDLYINGTVVAKREIKQGSLNLIHGSYTDELGELHIADQFYNLKSGHVEADINTVADTIIYNRGTLTITGGTNYGHIHDDRATEEEKFEGDLVYKSKLEISGGKFINEGEIKQDIINVFEDGQFQTAQNTLILPEDSKIENNGILTITGDGENSAALRVSKNNLREGPAETVITGALDNVERIYQDKLTITKDGSLEMDIGDDYSKFNVENIVNNGIFTITGGTIKKNITYDTTEDGASRLVINNGGVKVDSEDIVLTQKEIAIVDGGDFSVKAEQLVADKVINEGKLRLQGGTNTNKIDTLTDGKGKLIIEEDLINHADINQYKLEIEEGVVLTHEGTNGEHPYVLETDNLANAGIIDNKAILVVAGGANEQGPNGEKAQITGNGTSYVVGEFTNAGTITQSEIIVTAANEGDFGRATAGHFTTAVDSITANITNNGLLTWSGGTTGVNTNTVNGDNGTLELVGNIVNTGSITQNKVDTNGNTLTNNGTLCFKEAGINNIIVGSGSMEITGNVVQSGTLQQASLTIAEGSDYTADLDTISVNNLTNNGTLNANADASIRNDIAGTGTFNITGGADLVNNGSLTQSNVVITNGTLTTAANKVNASVNNAGTLILTEGVNSNALSGEGITQINTSSTVINNGTITQNALTVQSGTFKTNLDNLTVNTLTNNAALELTGGTLAQAITKDEGATNTTTNITGDVNVSGGSLSQHSVIVQQNGILTASASALAGVDIFTNNGILNAVGSAFDRTVNGNGEIIISSNMENTNTAPDAIIQNKLTVAEGFSFTTAADTLKADVVNNGTLTLTQGINNNAITNNSALILQGGNNNANISGGGTLQIAGNVANNNGKTIANNITINAGKTLTAYANDILGDITNNGTFALTGGTINQASLGGNTDITGNVSLAQNTNFANLSVAAGQIFDIAQNTVSANNMSIDGTLGMGLSGLAKDSSSYTGAKLNVASALTLGSDSKLSLTFLSSDLQTDEETDWLTLIEGEGTVNGSWNGVIAQNARYDITLNDDQRQVKVKYTISASEAAKDAGANDNEAAAAEAWDEEIKANPTSQIAQVMNTLSQSTSNTKEYVEALESLAPVQVAMTKANVSSLNQGIYTVASNHMSGGAGMAAGDMFSYKSVWMQGMYNNTKYDVEGGFDGNTVGGAVGLDIESEDDITAGVGYAYAYSSLNSTGKKIKADTQNIFLYTNYTGLERWYFDGTFGYNFGDYKENKTVAGLSGSGNYNVSSFALQAQAQYMLNDYITPLAGLTYLYAHQGKYTDGFEQTISSSNDRTLTMKLGATIGRDFIIGRNPRYFGTVLKPQVQLAAIWDIVQHGDDIMVSLTNSSYTIQSEQLKKFGAQAGFSLGIGLSDNVELTFGYDGQFRSHYYNHTGTAKFKYSF